MDFRDFTYVKAIAEYRTLSKAAEMLYVAQPSLTKFLQKLEQEIGTPLFERINKQMQPTYAGKEFLRTGEQILLLQDKLRFTLKQAVNHTEGILSLAITPVRGAYVLPVILPLFKERYPNYHIEIFERPISEAETALENGAVDLAIYSQPTRNRNLDYIHINQEEVLLCIPQDFPYQKYIQQRDGFSHPWIDLSLFKDMVFYSNDPQQAQVARFGQQLLSTYHLHPPMTILRSLDTCLALASRGVGVAFCYDICIRYFKNYEKSPVYLSIGKQPSYSEFLIGTRSGYVCNEAQNYFISLVKEYFGDKKPV